MMASTLVKRSDEVDAEQTYTLERDPERDPTTVVTGWATPKIEAFGDSVVVGSREALLAEYAVVAARHARCAPLDDGGWFADVVGLDGAWGEGPTPKDAEDDLREAIQSWAMLRLEAGLEVPPIDGLDVNGI